MSWYHLAQLSAFAIAAGLAWNTPRAAMWAGCLAVSYIISISYLLMVPAGAPWPPSQLIGLLCDGIVLIMIREFHKEKWEYYGLGSVMAFMVTADIIQLFGVLTGFPPPFSKNNFGVILESLNYLALALIGGVGIMDWIRSYDTGVARSRLNILYRAGRHAHSETDAPRTLRKW